MGPVRLGRGAPGDCLGGGSRSFAQPRFSTGVAWEAEDGVRRCRSLSGDSGSSSRCPFWAGSTMESGSWPLSSDAVGPCLCPRVSLACPACGPVRRPGPSACRSWSHLRSRLSRPAPCLPQPSEAGLPRPDAAPRQWPGAGPGLYLQSGNSHGLAPRPSPPLFLNILCAGHCAVAGPRSPRVIRCSSVFGDKHGPRPHFTEVHAEAQRGCDCWLRSNP